MSDLFSALTSATRALEAQRFALDVTGQNIANVNTPGYSRRVVDLQAVPPTSLHDAGHGVEVAGVRAQRDRLIDRRLGQEASAAGRETALADLLGVAELAIGTPGQGVDARMNEFFDSLARLADAPTAAVARDEVLQQANALAHAFHDAASRFEAVRRDADRQVETHVDEINRIAERLAVLNDSIGRSGATGALLHLGDEQTALVKQLSTLTSVTVIDRSGGGLDVDIAGRTLVVGSSSYALTATPVGPAGHVTVSMEGVDITAQLTGGKIAGALAARDTAVPSYLQRLDEQAFALANAVNTIHGAGYDLDGNTGQDFFAFSVAPVGVTGAAAALVVDPAVAANSRLVAAAAAPLAGDNRAARDMANLRQARLLDGGTATLSDAFGSLVFTVGRDVETASGEAALRHDIVGQLESLRDQVSGVSLDEEALQMLKFQRAYEANARFFQVVDQTLDMLLAAVGR